MAPVRGRLPRRPADEERKGPDERRVRAILPSWRVAEFRVPRVRDAMAIREEALGEGGDPAMIEDPAARARALVKISGAMERLALRRLLVGISDRPDAPEGEVDEVAFAKTARIRAISDLEWDESLDDDEDAGPFSRLANAYEGTPEADDWQRLHTFAGRLLAGLKALEASADPKASPRATPRSVGFVT